MPTLADAEQRFRQAVIDGAYEEALPHLAAYSAAVAAAVPMATDAARDALARDAAALLDWAGRMTRIGRQQAADALAAAPAAGAYAVDEPRRATLAIRG